MKIVRNISVFLAVILFGASCSSNSSDTSQPPATSEASASIPQDEPENTAEEADPPPLDDDHKNSNYIFDQNQLHTFELVLPSSS